MTKTDLIRKVAETVGISKKDAEIAVNTIFDAITEAVLNGDKVELRGFGSFRLRKKRARKGRNPRTGEEIYVPEKVVPYFKPGKELKKIVNQK